MFGTLQFVDEVPRRLPSTKLNVPRVIDKLKCIEHQRIICVSVRNRSVATAFTSATTDNS